MCVWMKRIDCCIFKKQKEVVFFGYNYGYVFFYRGTLGIFACRGKNLALIMFVDDF